MRVFDEMVQNPSLQIFKTQQHRPEISILTSPRPPEARSGQFLQRRESVDKQFSCFPHWETLNAMN